MKSSTCGLTTLLLLPLSICVGNSAAQGQATKPAESVSTAAPLLEGYPSHIQARLNQRIHALKTVPAPSPGLGSHFIISVKRKWTPGQVIRIAFRGGDKVLHQKIADVVSEWTKYANLTFDFGKNPTTGEFRKWTTADTTFGPEVRVSFDQTGYFSLVGSDSIDDQITRPGMESLNLEKFDKLLPSDWKTVATHEFGHAIGFEHEHQSTSITCDFRFDDDAGYVPTVDDFGQFLTDPAGNRPGLYTMLGGPPNNWAPAEVDFNLKPLPTTSAFDFVAGPFDKLSIMKYYFDQSFFVAGASSACYTDSEALGISAQDKVGAAKVYPKAPAEIATGNAQRRKVLQEVTKLETLAPSIKASFHKALAAIKD